MFSSFLLTFLASIAGFSNIVQNDYNLPMKSFIFAYLFWGLIGISIANNELQNNDFYDGLGRMPNGLISYGANMPLSIEKPVIDPDTLEIKEKIDKVNDKLLDLEVAIELGVDNYNFKRDVIELNREIWKHEIVLKSNDPGTEESRWNESELMLLEAKNKLDSLEEKIKLEGEWGNISLRYNPIKRIDPDLRYRFPF